MTGKKGTKIEYRPNLGLHPNAWIPKELRANLGRNYGDITMMGNITNNQRSLGPNLRRYVDNPAQN